MTEAELHAELERVRDGNDALTAANRAVLAQRDKAQAEVKRLMNRVDDLRAELAEHAPAALDLPDVSPLDREAYARNVTDPNGRVHDLKVIQPYFDALADGDKTFEVRKDDRGFQQQDTLLLREWTGTEYTGRSLRREITYVLRDGETFGVKPGFVVLAIKEEVPRA